MLKLVLQLMLTWCFPFLLFLDKCDRFDSVFTGQDFENMTKQKQMDNPKFQFLFGGEYYGYYTYRVTTEQAIMKHQSMRQQQQLQIPPNQLLQSQGMTGNPSFGSSSSNPPRTSRFGPSPAMQQFEQRQATPTAARFDHPPFLNKNFNQMNYERPHGPAGGGGNYQNFDRGLQQRAHFPPNFGGGQGQDPQMQMQQFDRVQQQQPGNFDRYSGAPGGQRFDRPSRPEFHPDHGHGMAPKGQTLRPRFDGGGPPVRFDRPMSGSAEFEQRSNNPTISSHGGQGSSQVFGNPPGTLQPQNVPQISQPAQQVSAAPHVNIESITLQKKIWKNRFGKASKTWLVNSR